MTSHSFFSARRMQFAVLGAIILALGFFYITSHAQTKPKRDFGAIAEVRYYRNSPQDIVTLRIPEGYIDRRVVGPRLDGVQNTLYFETAGPALLPQIESNQAMFAYPANLRNVIRFNVSSLYRLRPEQIRERTQSYFGVHVDDIRTPCKWRKEIAVTYGLRHETIDPASCPEIPSQSREDRYLLRSNGGDILTVIRCSPMDLQQPDERLIDGVTPIPIPYCEHTFATPAFNSWVHLRYHRELLPYWREMEQAVTYHLDAFVAPN